MERQFSEHGIGAQRVTAIDGAGLPPSISARYKQAYDARFPMGAGEIGCFLSHVECWNLLVESGETHALVMEDDVLFGDSMPRIVNDTNWAALDADIIKLETNFSRTRMVKVPVAECDRRGIHLLTGKHTSTGAYVISVGAVDRLKAFADDIHLPIDQFLFNPDFPIFHEMKILQVNPAPIVQYSVLYPDDLAEEISSNLDAEREVFKRANEKFFARRILKPLRKLGKSAMRVFRSLGSKQVDKRIKYLP